MKRLSSVFTLMLFLFIAACGSTQMSLAPAQSAKVSVQAQVATITTVITSPVAYPPLVLSTLPELGQEQPLDAPIEITFDQPMERNSVEKAFAIEPGASVDRTFTWVDDQTMQFAFANGFDRGERYRMRVVESARSAAGLEMQRPFELHFSAVGFLEVTNTQPADGAEEILPNAVVTVMFNRPVVALTAIENAASLPDPLTFVPPVRGSGTWLNTSIYQFTPDGAGFEPATQYTARVAQGLTDVNGGAVLEEAVVWTFTTVTPAAIASWPAEGDIYVNPSPVISLTFNQLMDHDSVEENFRLLHNETGKVVAGTFRWVDDGLHPPQNEEDIYYDYSYEEGPGPEIVGVETVEFRPKPTLEDGADYRLELAAGAAGATGSAQTRNDYSAFFTVNPIPALATTYPADGEEGVEVWQSLQITFNSPIKPESVIFGQNLLIEPPVSATQVYTYWWSSNTNLDISFPTLASTRYTVTLGADVEGRYGQQLGTPTTVSWQTRADSPSVYLHSAGRVGTYNAYTETVAYVSVRNIEQVNFGLYKLSSADFIELNGYNWWETWDAYSPQSSDLISEWTLDVTAELNSTVIYKVNIGQESGLGDAMPPGLYYLEATVSDDDVYPEAKGPEDQYEFYPERQMLVVSKNNLTLKASNGEALAWLTDLQSGQPVEGIPMTFYTNTDEGQGNTDSDGVATYTYATPQDPYEPQFAFAGDPDNPDENFAVAVSDWSGGIDRYEFTGVSVEDYQQPYNAHFYTDRKIYRPGQTVNFKGILRADDDARYSLPTAARTAQVVVTDEQGKEIFSDDLPLSPNGTINGSITLDANASLGYYSINIVYDVDNTFYTDFQVAAYRKPEFLVSAETDKAEYAQGETVKVSAQASFFFGGPVSNTAVRWTLVTQDHTFQYNGDGFYDFADYDTSRSADFFTSFGETLAEGSGTTDTEGRFTFEVEADIADKISSQRFTFDIVITDLNNQEVAAQAEAIVHKGLVYVGLRPEQYVSSAGQESRVEVLVVDWESLPVSGQEVEIVFAEHNWYSVQKQYDDGSFYWDSFSESIPVFTTTVTSAADGQAIAAFTPTAGGIYRVMARAEDSEGNEVRSSTFMWVSGQEYVNWRQENNDRMDLVADQREYKVGDTATILIPHPYSGTVKALVTLERGHIYDYFVIDLATNSEQLEIPITADMLPNMYVSVVVVNGSDEELGILPSFKVGYASLPINTDEKELQITLTPDKASEENYQPGDTVTYQVNVTDVQGQPVKAELSLALVDKAVLSLAPEEPGQLLSTFWHNRGLGVRTGGGLTLAIDRINATVAPEAKGGGGGFDEGFGVIRGDFRDTALWLADFVTDEDGSGVVEATLPDNLTTWTMTSKGVTGADTLVGESTVEIISTKPLLVRPVAPRFFVVNDQARLGIIVQNNSNEPQTVEVRFEAEGLEIGDWRIGESSTDPGQVGPWQSEGVPELTVPANGRVKVEYNVKVLDTESVALTVGAKSTDYGDAVAFELPVYRFSTPETVATVGILEEDGARTEGIALPASYDPSQGDLTVHIDPSLAAGMRDGLDYLEHFTYECTEQTVSRFLPNVFTLRAYRQLNVDNPELEARLPVLVSTGLQRLYNQQHFDGGWGWFIADDSDPFLTAYVLLGLVEAQRAGFSVDADVLANAVGYLEASLQAAKDIDESWQANRQAFILYVLAEAGQGDLGRSIALFDERQKLDTFGRAYLAMAIHILDDQAKQISTLLSDISSAAIVSATGAHWEEAQVDYYAMNTDTRSTAIVIAALSRIEPDNPLLPNAIRWLMSIRENGGHWDTTQETAWSIIGLTDYMVATRELEGNYAWRVSLNSDLLGQDVVNADNIDQTTKLQVEINQLLADEVNRLVIERDPAPDAKESLGRLYYAAYLTYYKPVNEVKALDRGIIVSRQYALAEDEDNNAISQAKVGDIINIKLTIIAPNDLHYVLIEDPFPAGAEGIDTSLATTSIAGEGAELERTDQYDPWGYNWWWFSHTELRDEKAVLFATYLPKGTYEYTYQIRASLPGEFNIIPTHAEQMYFPEVFGRSDGGLFTIEQ